MNFGANIEFTNMEQSVYGNVEEDAELLAELMALQKEEDSKQRHAAPTRPVPQPLPTQNKKVVPEGFDPTLLAAALADDIPLNDESIEDDVDLLNELGALVGSEEPCTPAPSQSRSPQELSDLDDNQMVSRLFQLSSVYKKLYDQAKAANDSAKVRRHQRALDKLDELKKKAEKGFKIMDDEIPFTPPGFQFSDGVTAPTLAAREVPPIPSRAPPPLPPRNSSSTTSVKREQIRSLLQRRRDAYVANGKLAVQVKDKGAAMKYVNTAKQFDEALSVLDSVPDEDLNIDEVPPSPVPFSGAPAIPERTSSATTSSALASSSSVTPVAQGPPPPVIVPQTDKCQIIRDILQRRKDANVLNGKTAVAAKDKQSAMEYMKAAKQFDEALRALDSVPIEELDVNDIPPSPKLYKKTEAPKTFLDGLLNRKARFEELARNYREKGEERKNRMNARMALKYEEAIKEHKEGRQIDVDELPSLPDMLPLLPQTKYQPGGKSTLTGPTTSKAEPSRPIHVPEVGPLSSSGPEEQSRNQTQLSFLIQRQNEFKQAAIHAKTRGNMDLAKKYLLEAKGFDPMIRASQAGLPVSIKNTPIPPQEVSSQSSLQPKIVSMNDRPSETGVEGRGEVLSLIERTLIEQIQMAETNRMRFTRLGDVGKVKLFEEWAKVSKKDLILVREIAKQGLRLPKFHYENRPVPNADIFPELAEDVLELTIFNAANVPLPSGYESVHANIFVKFDFPYPSESHQTGKTKLVAGTNSPEFTETVILQIGARKVRGQKLTRVLKRNPLKLEIFQKGGFLRSDKLLGTCDVKLDGLEGTAHVEECAPLKEGRKAVGGLLRVRVRIREPIGDAKLAVKTEKWLILDN